MISPYKQELEKIGKEKEVRLDRADTQPIQGELSEILDTGCRLKISNGEGATFTFVSYEDLRGISHEDWDYANIS